MPPAGAVWAFSTHHADLCLLLCNVLAMHQQPQRQAAYLFAVHDLAIHAILGILCVPVVHKLDEGQPTPLTCTQMLSVSSWQCQALAGMHPG